MERISSVSVGTFALPFVTPFANSAVRYEHLDYVRVRVDCGGVTGWGEVTAMPGYSSETVSSICAAIRDHYGPCIGHMDPFGAHEIEERIAKALPGNAYARSVVDLALTDLRARVLEVPMHRLLGGARNDSVPLAGIVTLSTTDAMARQAKWWSDKGAAALQVKISGRDEAVRTLDAIREIVGASLPIAVDGNGSFSRLEALRTMDAIERFDIAFFEQPVAVDDLDGMAVLVRKGCLPVVADEMLVTANDAWRIAGAGAAQGFNLKLNKSGLAETQRIIAVATAAGIPCGLGSMLESNFGTHAQVQFAATLRKPLFPAELVGPWLMRDDITGSAPGHGSAGLSWRVPPGVGCGVVPDNVTV